MPDPECHASQICYRSGYKFQLVQEYTVEIPVTPDADVRTDYIHLDLDGQLVVKKGYAWDGPSGPTIDTRNFMRGSLVHDALYQLMRQEEISKARWRNEVDRILRTMCREDGMNAIRAWWVYLGVRKFGDPSASPENKKKVKRAPRRRRMLT